MTKTDQDQGLLQLRETLQRRIDSLKLVPYTGDQIGYAMLQGRKNGYLAVLDDIDRLISHVHPEKDPQ